MVVNIKNNAGCKFKYAFKVQFSDYCLILVAVFFWIIIPERLLMVGLIMSCLLIELIQ